MAQEPPNRRMLGALLRLPFQAIVAAIHRSLTDAGYVDLGPSHFIVFQHLPAEGARLTDLARAAQITKQSMGYLVDHLEERGYVKRVPDPEDGRARLVQLTDKGY
ncbi:MAG TPA: MarR family transcriptional regulator, partial [Dehalococcoidia bacterium]|nr:MarR family transcriptional regulator [Dehalococcoidia bacterium]